jgi:hypothetical protein
MAHDVFISYAHKDKPTGDAVCATLEGRGIRCWMAPRDVLPGVIYSAAIVEAIHASRVFVLVFSAEANISPHVMRELERAVTSGIAVLPLRIEDVPLSPSMEYFISTPHWLDALTPPLEKHLVQLADTVRLLLQKADAETEAVRAAAAPPAPTTIEPMAPIPPPARVVAAPERGLEAASPPGAEPPRVEPWRVEPRSPEPHDTVAAAVPAHQASVPVATRARPIPRVTGGVSVRAMPKWALWSAAGLVLVVVTGMLMISAAGSGPSAQASASPSTSTTSSAPSATSPQGTPASSAVASTSTWTATGSMSVERVFHTAILLANGMVLVAGGAGGQAGDEWTIHKSAERYDAANGTWSPTGSMTTPRVEHLAVLLRSGKVLVIGGHPTEDEGVEHWLPVAELYDPAAGTWKATGRTSGAHPDGTVTLLDNGEVLVAGGDEGERRTDSEIYDPDTGNWRAGGAMQTVREGHTATLLANGLVLVAGGARPPRSQSPEPASASAELYDPDTGKWTSTASMASPRRDHVAVLLTDGRVLVAGGSPSWTSAELYDPDTGRWTAAAGPAIARQGATATLLGDGRVLLTGGTAFVDSVSNSEMYDPASGHWAAGPWLTVLFGHTSTLLGDGEQVLVAGGGVPGSFGGFSHANFNAEIFDPGPGG